MNQPPLKSINLNQPFIVGVVSGPEALKAVGTGDLSRDCDILEFRIDALIHDLDEAESAIRGAEVPALVTVRDPLEGGENGLDSAAREALYRRFLPLAAAVDLETRNLERLASVVAAARELEIKLVASFHDFEDFPENAIRRLLTSPPDADVIKIATLLPGPEQMETLFALFARRKPNHPAAVMGMGPLGPESRLRALEEGSVLNYGYLAQPNAPGQSSVKELREALSAIRPA